MVIQWATFAAGTKSAIDSDYFFSLRLQGLRKIVRFFIGRYFAVVLFVMSSVPLAKPLSRGIRLIKKVW